MNYDIDKAVKYLQAHAHAGSIQRCAHYTANAIQAGGITLQRPVDAKDFGQSLLNERFAVVTDSSLNAGDVVVIQSIPNHKSGHMAMYDGSAWISDFKQPTLYPGVTYRKYKPAYTIYRHLEAPWNPVASNQPH